MNIEATKIDLVKTILESESNDFLQKISDFINSEMKEMESLTPTELDIKKRAEASMKSIQNGNTRSLDAFITEVENWKNHHAI